VLRLGNFALRENVRLGPWIHVASEVWNLAPAEVGTRLSARARVAASYERKGHKFVELDVLGLKGDERPFILIRHTAIYAPRQVAAA